MDNLKLQAFPYDKKNLLGGNGGYDSGFTKLELAALMIAQGMAANGVFNGVQQQDEELSRRTVQIAKSILEQANK